MGLAKLKNKGASVTGVSGEKPGCLPNWPVHREKCPGKNHIKSDSTTPEWVCLSADGCTELTLTPREKHYHCDNLTELFEPPRKTCLGHWIDNPTTQLREQRGSYKDDYVSCDRIHTLQSDQLFMTEYGSVKPENDQLVKVRACLILRYRHQEAVGKLFEQSGATDSDKKELSTLAMQESLTNEECGKLKHPMRALLGAASMGDKQALTNCESLNAYLEGTNCKTEISGLISKCNVKEKR